MLALTLALLCGAEPGVLDPYATRAGLPRLELERRPGDAGLVTGLVTDDDGKPLEGVSVWLDTLRTVPSRVTTSSEGTFSFQIVPKDLSDQPSPRLAVALPGHVGMHVAVSDFLTPRFVRARLGRGAQSTLKVAYPSQVTGISLQPADPGRRWDMHDWEKTASLADGGFTFGDLLPGDYDVRVQADVHRVRLPAKNVTLAPLPRTGRIEGTAWPGARGRWYVDAFCKCDHQWPPDGQANRRDISDAGTFLYENLTPGVWTLNLRCGVRQVTVDGGTERVRFDASEGWFVRGRVLEPNGKPPREAVWVRSTEFACSTAALTEADGSFAFGPIDSSVSSVPLYVARRGPKDRRRWENISGGPDRALQGPTLLTFDGTPDAGLLTLTLPRPLPPRSISGKVVDPEGKPLAGVKIDSHGVPERLHPPVMTNARGAFTLKAPFEEALRNITFEKEGFVTRELHENDVKTVTLAREPKVLVRVIDASGAAVPGLHELALRRGAGTQWQSRLVRDGEAAAFDVVDGELHVHASLNDGRNFEQRVDAGVFDVVLTVPPR